MCSHQLPRFQSILAHFFTFFWLFLFLQALTVVASSANVLSRTMSTTCTMSCVSRVRGSPTMVSFPTLTLILNINLMNLLLPDIWASY
ncbi:unnamed protein product, partial [Dibothriocephalus latus]